MIRASAAVVPRSGAPFEIQEIELDDPRPDELLVDIVAAGLCHSDLVVVAGDLPTPFPVVLGHEGAGIVAAVGSAVTEFDVGDHVALSFASCGTCDNCLRGRVAYCDRHVAMNFAGARPDGSPTLRAIDGSSLHGNFFGQSSFCTKALVRERNAVRVPDDVPLELAGPLGCGLQTGAGAVLNTLDVRAGSSIVVSGAGSVGMAAVMAARAVGVATIVAVDVLESRLDLARELGATHTLLGTHDLVDRVGRLTGGRGADVAIETTGIAAVLEADLAAVRFGGDVGVIGVPRLGATLSFSALLARNLYGLVEGDAVPKVFIPELVRMWRRGDFPVDRLVSVYPFEDIGRAVADVESGRALKAVLSTGEERAA